MISKQSFGDFLIVCFSMKRLEFDFSPCLFLFVFLKVTSIPLLKGRETPLSNNKSVKVFRTRVKTCSQCRENPFCNFLIYSNFEQVARASRLVTYQFTYH